MEGLIGAWKRLMDLSERTEQSARSDRRSSTGGRGKKTGSHIQKTSAERAVERLAEKTSASNLPLQSPIVEVNISEQEKGNSLKSGKGSIGVQTAATKELPVLTSEEMKRIVEEALGETSDTEEIKEYLAQHFSILESQIMSVRNVQKQEVIAVAVREVQEKVDLIRLDTRKTGSIRVILGVSIGCNLITLAVLVAYVLHFI